MGGWENGELFNGQKVLVSEDEKFLESVAQQCDYMNTTVPYT